jgi:uncharacterized membrane protein
MLGNQAAPHVRPLWELASVLKASAPAEHVNLGTTAVANSAIMRDTEKLLFGVDSLRHTFSPGGATSSLSCPHSQIPKSVLSSACPGREGPVSGSLVRLGRSPLLYVGAAFLELVLACLSHSQQASATDLGRFTVDGLPLGGKVRTDSAIYKQYSCTPSTQYREFTFCKRIKTEARSGSNVTTTTTMLHSADGAVAYVNQFIDPASFSRTDIDGEVARLSTKYGEKARLLEAPKRSGLPQAIIATWGSVKLVTLPEPDLTILRKDRSPGKGILVDYLGDFTRSAQAGIPVYSIQGEYGYVWAANYNEQGRGTLRFLAINPARLTAALSSPDAQHNQPISIGSLAQTQKPAPQPENAALQRQLEECGESCPDKPALDKIRRDTLEHLEQAKQMAEDASRFAAAIGNEQALSAYISSCDNSKCAFRAEAMTERDSLVSARTDAGQADAEGRQYRTARGEVKALKQYVAECKVCAFARDAVTEINQQQSKGAAKLFDLEVCSNEFLPVFVAFVGRPDPNSDMWTSEGWYKIDSGKCRTIVALQKGDFFVTAHNKRAAWEGDNSYCTADRAFTRILLPEGGDCLEDEQSTNFIKKNFEGSDSKFTWTLNPKPWSYTALAHSSFSNSWGWSGSKPTLEQAQQVAVQECSKWAGDCRVVSWARDDSCLALARGTTGDGETSLGWATGDDYLSARRNARDACSNYGNACFPVQQSCKP